MTLTCQKQNNETNLFKKINKIKFYVSRIVLEVRMTSLTHILFNAVR